MPGQGDRRFAAQTDTDSTYAPVGRHFTVNTSLIKGRKIRAWWYDPRTGRSKSAGRFMNEGQRRFISPTPGEALDWVLVLDDADCRYPRP